MHCEGIFHKLSAVDSAGNGYLALFIAVKDEGGEE